MFKLNELLEKQLVLHNSIDCVSIGVNTKKKSFFDLISTKYHCKLLGNNWLYMIQLIVFQ